MDKATVDALNELMAAERAGMETLILLKGQYRDMEQKLAEIEKDEAWSCSGLNRCIVTLGGVATQDKGDFAAKVQSQPSLTARLQLLARGQGWVVKRLESLAGKDLPLDVTSFLSEMKAVHQRNIDWCNDRVRSLTGGQ